MSKIYIPAIFLLLTSCLSENYKYWRTHAKVDLAVYPLKIEKVKNWMGRNAELSPLYPLALKFIARIPNLEPVFRNKHNWTASEHISAIRKNEEIDFFSDTIPSLIFQDFSNSPQLSLNVQILASKLNFDNTLNYSAKVNPSFGSRWKEEESIDDQLPGKLGQFISKFPPVHQSFAIIVFNIGNKAPYQHLEAFSIQDVIKKEKRTIEAVAIITEMNLKPAEIKKNEKTAKAQADALKKADLEANPESTSTYTKERIQNAEFYVKELENKLYLRTEKSGDWYEHTDDGNVQQVTGKPWLDDKVKITAVLYTSLVQKSQVVKSTL